MPHFEKSSYTYTHLFCEENIWKLVESLYMNKLAKPIDVLFVLNQSSSIAVFEQHLSNNHKPVIWDYHVLLTAQMEEKLMVFDFDSRCDFPAKIMDYFNRTFPANIQLPKIYQPLIKSISAEYYHRHFYSDRKHMLGAIENSQFPNYEIIKPEKNIEKLSLAQCRNLQAIIPTSNIQLPNQYLESCGSPGGLLVE